MPVKFPLQQNQSATPLIQSREIAKRASGMQTFVGDNVFAPNFAAVSSRCAKARGRIDMEARRAVSLCCHDAPRDQRSSTLSGGAISARIGGATEPGMKILRDHPDTKARVAMIERLSPAGPNRAMLTAEEWSALRRICKD